MTTYDIETRELILSCDDCEAKEILYEANGRAICKKCVEKSLKTVWERIIEKIKI